MSNNEETNLLKLKEEGVIAHVKNAAFDGCTCGACEAVRELTASRTPSSAATPREVVEHHEWCGIYHRMPCNCYSHCCENGNFGDGHECMKQPAVPLSTSAEQELITKLVEALETVNRHLRDIVETSANGDRNNYEGYYVPEFRKLSEQISPLLAEYRKEKP